MDAMLSLHDVTADSSAQDSKPQESPRLLAEGAGEIERISSSLARLSSTSIEGLHGLTSELFELQKFLKAEVERVQQDIDSALAGINIIVETIAPFKTKPASLNTSANTRARNGVATWQKP
jgi:hypothetical protein